MSKEVEAVVGCGGLLLVFIGLAMLGFQFLAIREFIESIPTGVVFVFIGLAFVLAALRNKA